MECLAKLGERSAGLHCCVKGVRKVLEDPAHLNTKLNRLCTMIKCGHATYENDAIHYEDDKMHPKRTKEGVVLVRDASLGLTQSRQRLIFGGWPR